MNIASLGIFITSPARLELASMQIRDGGADGATTTPRLTTATHLTRRAIAARLVACTYQ